MSKFTKFVYCKLPDTPIFFDKEKFKAGDPEQIEIYKASKTPYKGHYLTYAQTTDEIRKPNYARYVPVGCMFIDFDDPDEAEEMKKIILRSGLRCLILKTQHGYHFLFRTPEFYDVEVTTGVNWFGYKFDSKGSKFGTKKDLPVQIMRVCGMEREEYTSWDLKPVLPARLDIEKLDFLPYWLWGKKNDEDLYRCGKYKKDGTIFHLTDTPFTRLMVMSEGGRHNYIFENCSRFAVYNGFHLDEFKTLIQIIHDEYLIKIGIPMSKSDLLGDIDERWEEYKAELTSGKYGGWSFDEETRTWLKVGKKAENKIDERRAAEYLFNLYDFYVKKPNATGIYTELLYRYKNGDYEYKTDLPTIRHSLKLYSDQNFRKTFFEEVEVQLMQMCAENEKLIKRNHQYVLAKNKVMSCITPDVYDFSWLGKRPPTDVVFRWTWQSEEWVENHKEDLGGLITKFIKELSRDSNGKPQPQVEQWLYVVAGASMIPANILEKIVILSGGGGNGKSIYTSLIRLCLGENMFNLSKIFDSSPQDSFWGAELDKGICCIVDDLPQHYNRDAFSYIKGAITKSDIVVINEKFKPKRTFDELPTIIACTNHDFKLSDKSEGMKRRVLILPTKCEIPEEERDKNLEHKLVLNTTDLAKINEYKMNDSFASDRGALVMNMYTKEKGVLDSLNDGSLCWFANKCRNMYFKWALGELKLEDTVEMKDLLNNTFKNNLEIQCDEFIKWYLDSKCGSSSSKDLAKANCHFNELYPKYEKYCEAKGLIKMRIGQFKIFCSKAIKNLGFQITDKKDSKKKQSYRYVIFDKPETFSKK